MMIVFQFISIYFFISHLGWQLATGFLQSCYYLYGNNFATLAIPKFRDGVLCVKKAFWDSIWQKVQEP
jgi:hypothetical protein